MMFGSKDYITPEQLEELLAPMQERISCLEKQMKTLLQDMETLQRRTDALQREETAASVSDHQETRFSGDEPPIIGINMDRTEAFEPQSGSGVREQTAQFTYFLQAPTPDGVFIHTSDHEQIGKSIYQLTTRDGVNGSFILMDSPDAIATAMISVSQFVKPVCKVIGNTHLIPRHIVTEEEGMAQKDVDGWRVTQKAVVRFE